jgi:RsiW-degrading membrane proteinase PrsW (M82 family)
MLLLSFLLVGVIEEGSKLWVLKRNGHRFFTSIDDVMEFSIIIAIGFAFAENVTNSGYFLGFVKEYVLSPAHADWMNFFGNVVGRSILTSMVHIVSTGVMGYFLGRAMFAGPLLQESRERGDSPALSARIASLFSISEESVFRTGMVSIGFILATFLHALSNFMVTLPDALPGNPRTLGDLVHSPQGSFLHYVALLLFPALLYVVGGFWLLTALFARQENSKERGRIVTADTFVRARDGV